MWNKAEDFLSKDKLLVNVIKKYGHCTIKPIKKNEYFSSIVGSIISQQLSGKAADTIYNRLKEALNDKVTPENILKASDTNLRNIGLSRQKTSYLKDLSLKVINKDLKIDQLDKLSNEEVEKELIAVKGIGKWTAEMFLMFCLAKPDIFPVDDLGVRNGMKKILKKELNQKDLAEYAEKWKPYRSIAAWYIWRSLENR